MSNQSSSEPESDMTPPSSEWFIVAGWYDPLAGWYGEFVGWYGELICTVIWLEPGIVATDRAGWTDWTGAKRFDWPKMGWPVAGFHFDESEKFWRIELVFRHFFFRQISSLSNKSVFVFEWDLTDWYSLVVIIGRREVVRVVPRTARTVWCRTVRWYQTYLVPVWHYEATYMAVCLVGWLK